MRVKDKVTIITGGANGIGRETALLFAQHGAKVLVADMDEPGGIRVVEELRGLGAEAEFIKADVSKPSDAETIAKTALTYFSQIDVLINNAGIARDGFLTKTDVSTWDRVISINLSGVFYCTQAVARAMLERGQGVILNASSVVGVYGNIGQTSYSATKAGVIGLTQTWAKELGPKGIRVNAVAPGFIETSMTEKVPEKVLEGIRSKTPLGRLGKPIEVAKCYLFLASDDASFINGAVLHVDGGIML